MSGPIRPWDIFFDGVGHLIGTVSQMKGRDTLPVKLLGEELVLYRDLSGTTGLIAARCPHRAMSMVYGIPEKSGLGCAYHGWLFDEHVLGAIERHAGMAEMKMVGVVPIYTRSIAGLAHSPFTSL